jgi:hypothetical protein
MRIARPILLVTTPIGVLFGLREAYRLAGPRMALLMAAMRRCSARWYGGPCSAYGRNHDANAIDRRIEPPSRRGGGCRGVVGMRWSIHAQLGAESVHIVSDGRATSGSSSVPARRINKCGRASEALVTGVPQRSQNWRCILLPLSAKLE